VGGLKIAAQRSVTFERKQLEGLIENVKYKMQFLSPNIAQRSSFLSSPVDGLPAIIIRITDFIDYTDSTDFYLRQT
jgi:hypothetical protein